MIFTNDLNLANKTRQWYRSKNSVKTRRKGAGIIRSNSFNDLFSETSSVVDSKTDESSIHDDSDIILDEINSIKGFGISDDYIVLRKVVLADLFNDYQATHTALLQMLPEHVIETLNRGQRVVPEEFDAVTILFSDIIGFTEIAAKVHPLLIVKLLNQLYTVMDHCATYFPLFKVETIGDAYMIVGGMTGNIEDDMKHASDIADFALLVQQACGLVKSPSDGSSIRLRIGIHTGPVAAGVVGNLMPRYCLFGSSVNCASRMESTCEPCHIQCSSDTTNLLMLKGTHIVEKRGFINVKGLGDMETYWLKGCTDQHTQSASFDISKVMAECQKMLDNFKNSSIGRYPLFKTKQDDYLQDAKETKPSKQEGIKGNEEPNREISLVRPASCISLLTLGETETELEISISSARGFKVLIISDCPEIRIAAIHLLKSTFIIDSCHVRADGDEAIKLLLFLKSSVDIVLIEKNVFNNMDDSSKRKMLHILNSRERLKIMIAPDVDPFYIDEVVDDFLYVPFPYPSAMQFQRLLGNSKDPYTTEICKQQLDVEPYRRHDAIYRIVVVESSIAVGKIMVRQLSAVFRDIDIPFNISLAVSGVDALDKCDGKYEIDLVIVDNVLPVEMQTIELLEILRSQPKTENSMFILLSKSALSNTAELIASGADLIWPKPLPDKTQLTKRLKRICNHYKF